MKKIINRYTSSIEISLAFYLIIRGLEIILKEESDDKMDMKYKFVINIEQMNVKYPYFQ